MTQVKLVGELGKKFGENWTSGDKSIREILKLIDCQVDGFKEYILDCHNKNIQFSIQHGEDFLDETDLQLPILKDTVIITPVPAGSGKGLGKLLAGLAILAAMFFTAGGAALFTATGTGAMAGVSGSVAAMGGGASVSAFAAGTAGAFTITPTLLGSAVMMLGTNLALAGLTEMSAPDPGNMTSDPSYLFNGAEQNIEQGQPVPVLYGKIKIGGSPIGQGFKPGAIKGLHITTQSSDGSINEYYGSSNGTGASTGAGAGGGGGTSFGGYTQEFQ